VGYTHHHFIGNLTNYFTSACATHSHHWAAHSIVNVKTKSTFAAGQLLIDNADSLLQVLSNLWSKKKQHTI
jgi:hypothetical protein